MHRIALLDPVGDAGIGGYTHELAEALQRAGFEVDVYSTRQPFAERLPRHYALIPVFGGAALDRVSLAAVTLDRRHSRTAPLVVAHAAADTLDGYFDVLARRTWNANAPLVAAPMRSRAAAPLDALAPSAEPCTLAAHLCASGYDTLWTQWPDLQPYGTNLRAHCSASGLRIVHTVHNVLPHERDASDVQRHAAVYNAADALVVHSAQAATALATQFPSSAHRIIESRHGTYTLYPRVRGARERVRARLGVTNDTVLALLFGGVRPYKNVDGVLNALRDPRCRNITVVVAGWEYGYPEHVSGDRLGRTRRLVAELGIGNQVRLLPGPFGVPQTSALFEASDVIALPYHESYGSGVQCLGMTFERHLLCTRTGGMAEYFDDYAAHTMIEAASAESIAEGLARAAGALRTPRIDDVRSPEALHWDAIVSALVPQLAAAGSRAAVTT